MAKVREQTDNPTGKQTSADGLSGASRSTQDHVPVPNSNPLMARVGGMLAPLGRLTAPIRQNAKPARPASPWGKLLFGARVYLLGSFLLQPLILLLFSWFHINPVARQPFFPANTWLIGTANVYTLVYFVFLAVFIWLLFRFNIIPRDPFNVRANAQRGAANSSGTDTMNKSASGSTNALRHAGRRRLPVTGTAAKARPSARISMAKTASKATTISKSASGAADGAHDDHYDRVRAQQRARRRKR